MFVTARNADGKVVPGGAVPRYWELEGFSTPRAIMAIRTAVRMEAKEIQLSQETFRRVLGRSQIQKMTRPTTAQTMVQVALLVRVFRQMVQVRMWEAMLKMRKMVWAAPPNSRATAAALGPSGRKSTWNASAMLWTQGCATLNWLGSC